MSVTVDDIFVGGQFPQTHGASCMELLGGDTHFAAKSKFAAVRKSCGSIMIYRRTVYCHHKFLCSAHFFCHDCFAMSGRMCSNMCDGFFYTIHNFDCQDIIQKFCIKIILACIFTLIVCLALPIVLLLLLVLKCKKEKIFPAWLLGAAGFFVTQILIRLPILTALSAQDWFIAFSQQHLFLYAFSLAFTAGLFELAGRFAVAKLMRKRLTCNRALAAGLGHGGIEAILIVGITYINNLIYIFMMNSVERARFAMTSSVGATPTVPSFRPSGTSPRNAASASSRSSMLMHCFATRGMWRHGNAADML